jgi:outer membrane immunogenic protein
MAAAEDGPTQSTKPAQRVAHRPIKTPPPPPPPPEQKELAYGGATNFAPAPAVAGWSGFYAGVSIGLGVVGANGTTSNLATTIPQGFHAQIPLGGAYAGFLWQLSSVVVGIESDFDYQFPTSSQLTKSLIDPSGQQNFNASPGFDASFRLRFGYPLGGGLLPYVTGGAAVGNWVESESYPSLQAKDSNSVLRLGWTLGTGLEYALNDKWTSRLEYRFTDFGTAQFSSALSSSLLSREHLYESYIRLGLGYKF